MCNFSLRNHVLFSNLLFEAKMLILFVLFLFAIMCYFQSYFSKNLWICDPCFTYVLFLRYCLKKKKKSLYQSFVVLTYFVSKNLFIFTSIRKILKRISKKAEMKSFKRAPNAFCVTNQKGKMIFFFFCFNRTKKLKINSKNNGQKIK
jgi:hypothetical protein